MSHPISRVRRRWRLAPILILAPSALGCRAASTGEPAAARTVSVVPMTADDILARCCETSEQAGSLTAAGRLHDARRPDAMDVPIRVDLTRDGRCRVQIGMDLVIVDGEKWWSHRPGSKRFRSHRCFSKTPVETAAALISDGALSLLPALFLRGADTFERDDHGAFVGWALEGVAWSGGRPCYLLERRERRRQPAGVYRLYVDQESWLIRRWTLAAAQPDDSERELLDVTLTDLAVGEQAPSDAFTLTPPRPLEAPEEVRSAAAY